MKSRSLVWLSAAAFVLVGWLAIGQVWGSEPAVVDFHPASGEIGMPRMIGIKYLIRRESFGNPSAPVTSLSIASAVVDREAVQFIAKLSSLRSITLDDVNIDDQDLAAILSGNAKCEWMNIARTDVSDDSVDALAKATALKTIHINNTALTRSGFQQLKQRRPDLEIYSSYSPDGTSKKKPASGPKP